MVANPESAAKVECPAQLTDQKATNPLSKSPFNEDKCFAIFLNWHLRQREGGGPNKKNLKKKFSLLFILSCKMLR